MTQSKQIVSALQAALLLSLFMFSVNLVRIILKCQGNTVQAGLILKICTANFARSCVETSVW